MTTSGPEPGRPTSPADLAAPGAGHPDDLAIPSLSPVMRRRLAWLAIGLVVAVIAAAIGFAVGGASRDGTVDDLSGQVGLLGDATAASIRISAEPDVRHVALTPTLAGDRAAGEVSYSASAGLLLAVASGLAPEPAGYSYHCWFDSNGLSLLGPMTWAGGAWSWSGRVDGLAGLADSPGAFRVSLVWTGDMVDIGQPVLTGAP